MSTTVNDSTNEMTSYTNYMDHKLNQWQTDTVNGMPSHNNNGFMNLTPGGTTGIPNLFGFGTEISQNPGLNSTVSNLDNYAKELQQLVNSLNRNLFQMFNHQTFPQTKWMNKQNLAVDITEFHDSFVIKSEVAGLKKNDVKVYYSNGQLTIKAVKERQDKIEANSISVRKESFGGVYTRHILLTNTPEVVDAKSITAKLNNGILEITIQKTKSIQNTSLEVPIS